MREDLPCEEPLPKLWSIRLAAGGDIVDGGPCLEDFDLLEEPLELGGASRCWRVRSSDDRHHMLCETRFILPERFAIPQLGRLRELLLREARLLDALSHGCVVPLESGWLEQRAGFEDPHPCAFAGFCAYPSSGGTGNRGEGIGEASNPSGPVEDIGSGAVAPLGGSGCQNRCRGGGSTNTPKGGCSRQQSALPVAAMGPTSCRGVSCRDLTSSVWFFASGEDGSHSENDVAAFLLRSWVPLTLEDVDSDDRNAHQGERGEPANSSNTDISDGGSRNGLLYGGLEQLRWGGDDKTDWRGTAEPKTTARRTMSHGRTPAAENPLESRAPRRCDATTGECCCSCAYGSQASANDGRGCGPSLCRRERALSLASYLLLPDWLPLSVWFETEFEPRTASSDEPGGAVTTRAVTAPDDWALVWRYLLSMFVQVVRGVEHLHTQGLIHNNVSPSSIWVATDGRCCVGNLSQAAPPGYRRAPPRTASDATRYHYFASPERRQGRRVGAKSDLYSLGVLMLEFWRNYAHSRGLEELYLVGDDGLVERIKSGGAIAEPDEAGMVLDTMLVRSMLAEEPFDRPDCFEVIESLDES